MRSPQGSQKKGTMGLRHREAAPGRDQREPRGQRPEDGNETEAGLTSPAQPVGPRDCARPPWWAGSPPGRRPSAATGEDRGGSTPSFGHPGPPSAEELPERTRATSVRAVGHAASPCRAPEAMLVQQGTEFLTQLYRDQSHLNSPGVTTSRDGRGSGTTGHLPRSALP